MKDLFFFVYCGMKEEQQTYKSNPFLSIFEEIEDSRNQDLIHYSVPEILYLLLIGILCGCNELTVISAFGEEKLYWFRKYYPYKYGIPSHDTLNRVLKMVDKKKFEKLFICWVAEHFGLAADALIHFDGKRLNSSTNKHEQNKKRSEGGIYAEIIVNVYASGAGIVLAQNNVSDKMDEIRGALELLDWLDLEGCCITGDANFCRKNIVAKIISNKANYLLALKGHLPTILAATKKSFEKKELEKSSFSTEETGHGRYEKRDYRAIQKEQLPKVALNYFSEISQIIEVRRLRIIQRTGKKSEEIHYYITNLDLPVKEIADKIRRHWSIENNLHYVLDVSYGEDDSRVRKGNGASNLSLIRKASLNILSEFKEKGSIKAKRLRLAISDSKRDNLLEKIMMR